MMRAILVADHRDAGDTAIGNHAAFVVGLAEKRVHPFEHALAHARRLAKPDWRAKK